MKKKLTSIKNKIVDNKEEIVRFSYYTFGFVLGVVALGAVKAYIEDQAWDAAEERFKPDEDEFLARNREGYFGVVGIAKD